jgi:hypothetical protein
MVCLLLQGTPVFNAPTLAARNLLHFAQGVLVLRKQYRNMLSPPMFDSPRAIRWVTVLEPTALCHDNWNLLQPI